MPDERPGRHNMGIDNTRRGAEGTARLLYGASHLAFAGAGGVCMSALTVLAGERGFSVTGYDRCASDATEELIRRGISVQTGEKLRLGQADALIYSAALSPNDPLILDAVQRGIPLISRADFLSYLMESFPVRIAVAGTHGKSTVTAMINAVLQVAGKNPTVVSGAPLGVGQPSFIAGGNEIFLFEACEYRGSFLSFSPTIGVILNIDLDHTDCYPDLAAVTEAFRSFAMRCETVLVGTRAAPLLGRNADFGTADVISCENGLFRFHTEYCGGLLPVSLRVPGVHNAENALAAIAVAKHLGLPNGAVTAGLSGFGGIERRLTVRGTAGKITVYDDYAHHPAEIRASVAAVRRMSPGRIGVIFQPHTYSRTRALFDGFAEALTLADRVWIADIYPARETDTLGMSGALLASRIPRAQYCSDRAQIVRSAGTWARPHDTLLVMGAGDINNIIPDLLGFLQQK